MAPKRPWNILWKILKFFWGTLANATLKKILDSMVVTLRCEDDLRFAAVSYFWRFLKPSRRWRAPGCYSFAANLGMLRMPAHLLVEDPDETPILFWMGWVPLWIVSKDFSGNRGTQLHIKYLRWTVNAEKLLEKIVADARQRSREAGSRFSIIQGTGGTSVEHPPGTARHESTLGYRADPRWNRMVGWSAEDLGTEVRNPLDRIVLHPEVVSAVAEVRRWWASRATCKERGIPWTFGWLLVGPPGCGKSSLAVAIAEDLGIPLYSLDMSQMSPYQLKWWFAQVRANTPAILLFEDIDRIFDKDKQADETVTLNFSALLNELSGVVSNEGIFAIVTANDPAKIDPALFDMSHGASGFGRRLDRMVRLEPPGSEQRRELARRILVGEPEEVVEEVVAAGHADSFKEFTSRCSEKAFRSLLSS